MKRLYEKRSNNEQTARDYALGLMILTQTQFNDFSSQAWKETFSKLELLLEKDCENDELIFEMEHALRWNDYNLNHVKIRFSQRICSENMNRALAVGLSELSAVINQYEEMKTIIKLLEILYKEYPKNESIASSYAEGLYYCVEALVCENRLKEKNKTLIKFEALASQHLTAEAVQGYFEACKEL